MKKTLLVSLAFCALLNVSAQNDPLYNQYQFNQLLINPAYAGANDRMTAMLLSRVQWVGVDGAPVTNTASVHSSFRNAHMGLGATYVNDRAGINVNQEVNVQYSYRIDFGRAKLQFGLQGGYIRYAYDYSKLTLESPVINDPSLNMQMNKFAKANIGAGLFLYGENYYIGLSVPRLTDTRVNDGIVGTTRYRRSEYLSAGYIITVGEALKLKPSLLVKSVAGSPISVDLNFSALFAETVWVGLMLRNTNTVGLVTQLEISDRFRLGYTYEYQLKPLNVNNYGTHEIMLAYDFAPFRNQLATRRYF